MHHQDTTMTVWAMDVIIREHKANPAGIKSLSCFDCQLRPPNPDLVEITETKFGEVAAAIWCFYIDCCSLTSIM